jgi:prepilin-type processing-associated H-X9-DG protein
LSATQSEAGWSQRIRSYSMNAMVGNVGASLVGGDNVNNPGYRQFLKMVQIPDPTEIFVFLDEHPSSIDDGYFLEKDSPVTGTVGMNSVAVNEWHDLPASYHNRSAAFSFADGHAALHHWLKSTTYLPPIPQTYLPIQIPSTPADEDADFDWVVNHMSVEN